MEILIYADSQKKPIRIKKESEKDYNITLSVITV